MKHNIISDKINFKAETYKNICLLAFTVTSINHLGHSGHPILFYLNKYDTVKVPLAENQHVIYK